MLFGVSELCVLELLLAPLEPDELELDVSVPGVVELGVLVELLVPEPVTDPLALPLIVPDALPLAVPLVVSVDVSVDDAELLRVVSRPQPTKPSASAASVETSVSFNRLLFIFLPPQGLIEFQW